VFGGPVTGTACPSRAELARFALGDLDAAALARVAGHVEHCPACESALQTLDGVTDPLLTALRQPTCAAATDDVPPALLTAARSALDSQQPNGSASGELPRRVGKFRLLEELGSGSFGAVFRAFDT